MKKLILMIAITLVAFNSWAVDCSYMEERMSRLKSYGIKMNSYANKSIDQYNRALARYNKIQ